MRASISHQHEKHASSVQLLGMSSRLYQSQVYVWALPVPVLVHMVVAASYVRHFGSRPSMLSTEVMRLQMH